MVTRKPLPSVSTTTMPAAPSDAPPYPITPHPESAKPADSNDHNASSAFDLIDMGETQTRTRRDSDVSSHGTWDSDDTDREDNDADDFVEVPKPLNIRPSQQSLNAAGSEQEIEHPQRKEQGPTQEQASSSLDIPDILKPGRSQAFGQPASLTNGTQQYADPVQANPWQLDSKNPFLKPNGFVDNSQSAWRDQSTPMPAAAPPPPPSQAPPPPPPPPSMPSAAPAELPGSDGLQSGVSKLSLNTSSDSGDLQPFTTANTIPRPMPTKEQLSTADEPASSANTQAFPETNPWRSRSTSGSRERNGSAYSPSHTTPTIPEEPRYAPPPGPPPTYIPSQGHTPATTDSLIDLEEQPARAAPAPVSAAVTTNANAASQSNQTYQIKHITWHDAGYALDPRISGDTRSSPILVQNANGPCPLLALVNALVLSTPSNEDTPLVHTLKTREDISLELLLSAVFDELTSGRRGSAIENLPDISELYTFLLTLHTGMNVNPRFITPAVTPRGSMDGYPPELGGVHPMHRAQSKPGAFQETREMRLYSTFDIPLIHGWVPPSDTSAYEAFARSAPTFEDAQNIQFAEADLETKLRTSSLTESEQQTLQDIVTIKKFLNAWPTQLTDHGLEAISKSLASGDIAILFRNDHFSLLYKEPRHGALMTLVTDAGYRSHEEIVWESLVDVNGAASELFSGDFRSVSHTAFGQGTSTGGQGEWQQVQGRNRPSRNSSNNADVAPPLPGPRPHELNTTANGGSDPAPQLQRSASEQEDHDMALAMQLQMEEEDRERQLSERRQREQELSEEFLYNEERPPIPPRRPNSRVSTSTPPSARPNRRFSNINNPRPAVNRPADEGDSDAPPSYEQAASDRPYRPAGSTAPPHQGNVLNTYDALRNGHRSSTSVNTVDPNSRRRNEFNRIRRRSSQMGTIAYRDGYSGGNSPISGPEQAPAYPGTVSQTANGRTMEDERCVIM